jgi:hypothetical protein
VTKRKMRYRFLREDYASLSVGLLLFANRNLGRSCQVDWNAHNNLCRRVDTAENPFRCR